MTEPQPVLSTRKDCADSGKTREWLTEHAVAFIERDVTDAARPPAAIDPASTPLLVAGGVRVSGFRPDELAAALGLPRAVVACPGCGTRSVAFMPTSACVRFYRCEHCGAILTPKPGDCCVFCSYADRPCPPVQAGADRC